MCKYGKKDYLEVYSTPAPLRSALRSTDLSEDGLKSDQKSDLHSAAQGINGSSVVRHRRAEQEESEAPALKDSPGAEHLSVDTKTQQHLSSHASHSVCL